MMALALGGVAQAAWFGVGSLSSGRYNHTATLLDDGRVLVAGGNNSGPLAGAQVYDPVKNTWSNAASMHIARTGQAAVQLKSGKVLVAGGFAPDDANASRSGYTRTAEVYDPSANTWTQVGDMSAARYQPTITLLEDGRVLVAGGSGDTDTQGATPLQSAEIYNPQTESWSDAASMSAARANATATLLRSSGKVLVAGGYDDATGDLASAELYDADADSWTPADSLAEARDSATATALQNGDVLVAGGDSGKGNALSSAEVYDASAGSWHAAASMAAARQTAAAALLKDGTVLVTGGESARLGDLLDSAERYDPDANAWTSAGTLAAPRKQHTLTALEDGRALVVGGNPGGFDRGLTGLERFSAMTTSLTDASFGSELVGHASAVKTSVLTNTGNQPLSVTGVSIAGAKDFAIESESCSGATVQPGETCEVGVQFTPSAGGARNAQLNVTDNQTAAGQTTATLSGTGHAPAQPGGTTPPGNSGSAPAAGGSPSAAPGGGIAVAGTTAKSSPKGKRPGARAACSVKNGSRRSSVSCRVTWPTRGAVALNVRLMRGSTKLASARTTARGGRAVVSLQTKGRLRSGRYTVVVSRRTGATVIRQGVRVR